MNVPGNPPSTFLSHSVAVSVAVVVMVIAKIPPVEGMSETSPREVENVERSSWASWMYGVRLVRGFFF